MTIILECNYLVELANVDLAIKLNQLNLTREQLSKEIHEIWKHEEQVLRVRFENRLTQYLKDKFGEDTRKN